MLGFGLSLSFYVEWAPKRKAKRMGELKAVDLVDIPKEWLPSLIHNGVQIEDYGEDRWFLVPFPASKGTPFNHDNLASANQSPFLNDSAFLVARDAAYSRWGGEVRNIDWRLHVFIWAANTALKLNPESCFLELGTGRGFMAAGFFALSQETGLLPKKFYLADKYSKTAPNGEMMDHSSNFMYASEVNDVREHFRKYPQVEIISGQLPDCLGRGEKNLEPISFLHVDLNSPSHEVACLEALIENLVPGAIVLFDDSGNPGMEDSMTAHQRFADDCGAPLLVLPTGQALLTIPV